jgi:hypothetical protein
MSTVVHESLKRLISIDPGEHPGWAEFRNGWLVDCGDDPWNIDPCEHHVIIERPTVYSRSPVPPNDIVTLAIEAGRIAERFGEVEWVLPRTWKGTVPKSIMTKRILAALTPEDFGPVPEDHNVIDAIGLGLWRLDRL